MNTQNRNPEVEAKAQRRYRERHPGKVAARAKAWRKANPERYAANQKELRATRARQYQLAKYGLTEESWQALFVGQGEACAACKSSKPMGKRPWHVDHDHDTGQVRAILCHGCNTALGHLKDSPMRVSALLEYIGGHSCA